MKIFLKNIIKYDLQIGYKPFLHLQKLTQGPVLIKAKEINLCERKGLFHGQNTLFHGQKEYFREQKYMFHGRNALFHGQYFNTFSSQPIQFHLHHQNQKARLYV